MITELDLSAGAICSLTETPMCRHPRFRRRLCRTRALPGLSMAPTTLMFSGLLRRADHRAAHAPADPTDDNSQGHLVLQQPEIAEGCF